MDSEELELMRDVCIDFYLENKSKVEIAQQRELSRFRVARLLSGARDAGIVKISIELPDSHGPNLATLLSDALGVPVSVCAGHSDVSTRRDLLARSLAEQISDHVKEGMTVGVSWSRTIEAAAAHVSSLPPCEVIQLVGAQPIEGSGNSLDLIQHFKNLPGVTTVPIWSPLLVNDSATAAGMRTQPQIATALARADSLDLAVVAIGGWSAQASTVYSSLSPEAVSALSKYEIIGECSGRVFDSQGRDVHTVLDERVIAVTLDQLRRTTTVIAAGFGAGPAPAVLAAVRGGFANNLVLDSECAKALVTLVEQP